MWIVTASALRTLSAAGLFPITSLAIDAKFARNINTRKSAVLYAGSAKHSNKGQSTVRNAGGAMSNIDRKHSDADGRHAGSTESMRCNNSPSAPCARSAPSKPTASIAPLLYFNNLGRSMRTWAGALGEN